MLEKKIGNLKNLIFIAFLPIGKNIKKKFRESKPKIFNYKKKNIDFRF